MFGKLGTLGRGFGNPLGRPGRVVNVFPNVPSSGLTHNWPMDDAHVTGTTITDIAGSLNGTANGTHVTSGTFARNLDGSGFISLASSPIANFATAHSVFVWVDLTSPTSLGGNGGSQTVLNFATDANNGIRLSNDEGSVDGFPATSFVVSLLKGATNIGVETTIVSDAMLKAGVLVLIGYTFDGTNIITYRGTNAVPHASQTTFGVQNQNNIGTRASDLTGSVTGSLGRVVTYSRAITAAEVAQIQAAGPAGIPSRKRTIKLTAGAAASNAVANSYVEYSLSSLQVGLMDNNVAIDGETLAQFDTGFSTLLQPSFDSTFAMNLLTIQNTNDMDIGGTAAAAYASAASIAGKWKALGSSAKVLILGAWNFGGNTAFIQKHADFNTLAIANTPSVFDGYVDTFNIPNLNTGTTPLSTTYSLDNNHLTKAGHLLVVPFFVAGVNAIWNS